MLVNLVAVAYVISGVLFITALRGLSSPDSSRTGNLLGMAGMAIAVIATLFATEIIQDLAARSTDAILVIVAIIIGGIIGAIIAKRIAMTDMPQLVAAFHSLVGLAAVFVAVAAFYDPTAFGIFDNKANQIKTLSIVELSIGAVVGAITFSGSVIAFAKLQGIMSGAPIVFKGQHFLNLLIGLIIIAGVTYLCIDQGQNLFWIVIALSFLIGFLIIIPIGGADMPVVVSMLNSYSGWAAAGIGLTLQNSALIITGALVGSSGAILSYIMCAAMNRSFISVILGGFGAEATAEDSASAKEQRPVKEGSADDAAFIMKNASSVIIVPGYGMAVAQAQHTVKEMTDALKNHGVKVSFAIHPVAGRMPGHMNVLLAEASVGYEDVFELEDINSEFAQADVAFVIGANDVTNPIAKTDPASPIFGMPILDVEKANTVLFVKRGRGLGYAGVDNELFYRDNTMMLFSDAKKMVEGIVKSL